MVATIASEIETTIGNLSLEEKVSLLSGKDFWRTQDIPSKGVAALKSTDGPAGARGGQFTDGTKAAFFPSGVSMAATFDQEVLRTAGQAIAQDALSKQASILLAPTTCIHRSPLGGRNFESYSEDPYLSGKLTASFVNGVQSERVAATVKHYVANEQETDRFTVDEIIDERTLREIYLYPFEIAVKESNPWCLMTAYNVINGQHADVHDFTLGKVLRTEWKYDGLVMSDWGGTSSTSASVLSTLDLEMPGPTRKRGDLLLAEAKRSPELQQAIDNSVRRLLTLISRVGRWKDFAPEAPEEANPRQEYSRIIRSAACDGIVLLKNADVLPIAQSPKSILVIGPNAIEEVAGGGGSASLNPHYMTNPLQSIKDRFGDTEVTYEQGCVLHKYTQLLSGERGCRDAQGRPGAVLTYYTDESLSDMVETRSWATGLVFPIDSLPTVLVGHECFAKFVTTLSPAIDGTYMFGLASIGPSSLFIDGVEVLNIQDSAPRSELMFTMGSSEMTHTIKLVSSKTYEIVVVTSSAQQNNSDGPMSDNADFSSVPGFRVGCTLVEDDEAKLMAAVEKAKAVDYVVAVVGLNNEYESEGFDMLDIQMSLPGLQNRLISEVAKVNKNVIVCNQSGVPIAMPWIDAAGAILQCWYQGMEMGNAIADVISGDVNPSGKLPVTFPEKIEDTPCYASFGLKHKVEYSEGIYVGYRHYDKRRVSPLFPFGFGLSYTTFTYANLQLNTLQLTRDNYIRVSFNIHNSGHREGQEAWQVYVAPVSPSYQDRAIQELKGFGKVFLKAGSTKEGVAILEPRAVCRYDAKMAAWTTDKGDYAVLVGSHSRDIRLTGIFTVKQGFEAL